MTDDLDSQTLEDREAITPRKRCDWLHELKVDGPRLPPYLELMPQCASQTVPLTKEEFEKSLQKLCRDFCKKRIWGKNGERRVPPIDSGMVDRLYWQAVEDCKQAAAWDNAKKLADSEKFRQSLEYVKRALSMYLYIIKVLLPVYNKANPPNCASTWQHAWIGTFTDLCYSIYDQLLNQRFHLMALSSMNKLGRTNILGDHFKSGQQLSLQNRPTEVAVQD